MEHPTTENASTVQLLSQLKDQVSTLVQDEIRLAQAEIAATPKRIGMGAGYFGASGLLALLGLGAFVTAAILGLAEAIDGWLAALVVGAVLLVIAGAGALLGKRKVDQAIEAPKTRVESVKADVAEVKEHHHDG
ncbi:hypothetical protein BH09ACT10_BH09ACT10_15970 [soil metagenome]